MKAKASITKTSPDPSRYGWVIVVIAALAMVATLPGRTHGLGMITERLLSDPDLLIDRLSFSEINFWGTLLGGLFCLPCGWFIDRFGLRITLTFTVGALAIVVFWMTRLHGSREFAVAVMLTRGFGQSALSVISITMVGKWFTQRTSLAMAVYSMLLSLGFAYAAQIAKPWAEADWRVVWDAMGYSLAAFVPVCFIFCRDPRPHNEISSIETRSTPSECCGLSSDPSEGHRCENSFTLVDALRTQAFWVFALATSLVGLIGSGLSLFNESVLTSQGFSKDVFYNLITLTGTVGLLTKLPIGWIGQQLPLNRLLTVGLLLQAICMATLPFVRSVPGISLYGVGMGISGTITTVLFFTIWSRAFGRTHLGQIQSVAQLLTVLASAAGPVIFARCLNLFGSYAPAFMALAIASCGFAVWSWFVSIPEPSKLLQSSASLPTTATVPLVQSAMAAMQEN
ncbi:MAG: MFS transporter [Planctomycetota bacterium]